jgi:hypothetical protein
VSSDSACENRRTDSRRCSISSLMSGCIASRLDSSIAAAQNLIRQLSESSNQVPLDSLHMHHVLSTYPYNGAQPASTPVRAIALLKRPVTPTLLAALLELPLQEVTVLLQTLVDAQIVMPESPPGTVAEPQTFRMCDQSLLEFSVDSVRSRTRHDMVDPAENHRDLLVLCLRLLNENLREDICDIRNPGLANADVADLPARIARSVPEAVRYACVSWPVHLLACGSVSGTVSAALLNFCEKHLLHWLEVLSLLGELSSAGNHLPKTIAWYRVSLLFVS